MPQDFWNKICVFPLNMSLSRDWPDGGPDRVIYVFKRLALTYYFPELSFLRYSCTI